MKFGNFLRSKREEQGLTLAEVAGRAGISIAYLSRIERDRENAPKDELIAKLSRALGLEKDQAFAAASRLPPDLRKKAFEVIAAYRRGTGMK